MDTNDPTLIAELRRDEGVRYSPYKDSLGIETVGVGHNLEDQPIDYAYPLNDTQVDEVLAVDLKETFDDLDSHLPWWRNMNYPRQRAIANMCFNLGITRLLEFKNTLAAMQHGNWPLAVAGMKASKWAAEVGARADRLEKLMEAA